MKRQQLDDDDDEAILLLFLARRTSLSYRERVLVPEFRLNIVGMADQEAKDQFRFVPRDIVHLAGFQKSSSLAKVFVATPCSLWLCVRCVWPSHIDASTWRPCLKEHRRRCATSSTTSSSFSKTLWATFSSLTRHEYPRTSSSISRQLGAIEGVLGFIDGTVRPICRPNKGQQAVYNSHKRVHAFKFQTVVTPDGLISHLFGPIDGRRHDLFMLNESGLWEVLEGNAAFHKKLIYGDPAYGCTNVFCCPYKGCRIDLPQKELNKAMSALRVSVEWSYGQVTRYFSYLDFKRQQCVAIAPVASLFKAGVLFTNGITIVNGGNTNSRYFDSTPPTLEEYFASYTTKRLGLDKSTCITD